MKCSFKFILSIMVLLMQFSAFASEKNVPGLTDYSGTWWFNLGAGTGSISGYDEEVDKDHQDGAGFAGAISFNYAVTNNQLLTVRSSTVGNLGSMFAEVAEVKHIDSVVDVGVLYGLMHKSDMILASISAGLAYTAIDYGYSGDSVYDDDRGYYTVEGGYSNVESTIGVPFEAQLFWTPTSFLGLGLIGLANVNSEVSYVAGLLAIQVGDLK